MININTELLSNVNEKEYWLLGHIAKRMGVGGGCWPSIATLKADTRWKDERTVKKYLKSLSNKGILGIFERFGNDGKQLSNKYVVKTKMIGVYINLSELDEGSKEQELPPASDVPLTPASDAPQSINHIKYSFKVDSSTTGQIPYNDIIDYLNEKTGAKFRYTTKSHQAKIRARWREGFTLENFKLVIDCKVTAWMNDNKMREYLRPETLFGTKFESYLNACTTQPDVNMIHDLIDIELSEPQSHEYLNYHQKMKDTYPRLYSTVRMLKASEFFELRPGGKRHEKLIFRFTSNEINNHIVSAHKNIEYGLNQGRKFIDVYTELNSSLRSKAC